MRSPGSPPESTVAPTGRSDGSADRRALGFELERRVEQISQAVVAAWHQRSPEVAAAAQERVLEDILRATQLSSLAVAHYLTDGESQTAEEARAIAATGKAPLRDTISMSELMKLYLFWRDITIGVLTESADANGIEADVLREAVAIVRRGSDGSIVRTTKEFDTEYARLRRELSIEQSRLTHHAFHDALTGLPNRRLFFDRLAHALEVARRYETSVALLFIDIDEFKSINDRLGHIAGDTVLTMVAERLLASVRESDTVARLGGDEFVVLCEQLDVPERDAVDLASRIGAALTAPAEGIPVRVAASIGIALASASGDADTLVRDADRAMYVAKQRGRGKYHLWAESA